MRQGDKPMNKRQLVEIIAKVTEAQVKKFVKSEVKKQLTEHFQVNKFENTNMERHSEQLIEQEMNKPNSLQEALQQTAAEQEEWPTAGNFTSADAMRSKFSAMQQGPTNPIPTTDVNGRPLNPTTIAPDVMKALTRDYSSLMKHPKMQNKK